MSSFSRILSYLWPQAKKYKISFALVFIGYGIGVLLDTVAKPFIYKEIIDAFTSNTAPEAILHRVTTLAILLCFIIVFYVASFRVGDYATSYFESRVMKELHDMTFDGLLDHSYHFFSSNFSGSIVAKAKRFSKSFETFFDVIGFQVFNRRSDRSHCCPFCRSSCHSCCLSCLVGYLYIHHIPLHTKENGARSGGSVRRLSCDWAAF